MPLVSGALVVDIAGHRDLLQVVIFDLPIEGVILITGTDELMDMARTTVNLVGHCLANAVVARREGGFTPVIDPPSTAPQASSP